MRALRLLPLLALGGLLLVAAPTRFQAPAAHAAQAQGTPTRIVNFDYVPRTLQIDAGTTVTWTNTSNRPHTATDRGGTFDTRPIQPGHGASVTFSVPGTYSYFCQVNPAKMNGVVVVRPKGDQAKAVRVQASDSAGFVSSSFRFEPDRLTVQAGTTLLVGNVGGKPHTLTADDGSFDSGVIDPGAEGGRFAGHYATISLSKPGTHPFHCTIHPDKMKGVLTVEGAETAARPPPSDAARQVTVGGKDFSFNPNDASVAPGGAISFQNQGKAPHSLTLDDVQLDSGVVQPGASAKLVAPTKPGSYSYHCTVHPAKMQGVLVVLAAGVEDPARKAAAAAATPAATVTTGGPGGGITTFVLVTAVLAAFLGGFGLSAFAFRRRTAT
jgi:plastocyanin